MAIDVYDVTEAFPQREIYGLTSQVRRASVSVVSNIAEGQGRLTSGEFAHFLGNSRGSLLELETQLEIAFELNFIVNDTYESLMQQSYQVLGLLNRLIESLRASKRPVQKVESVTAAKRETLKP